ncbi:transporter substrate-binding domain-containing protein [Ruegeria sp. HKCCD6428]|uniref:transporter substrate-binding domain-containing protein n=1 Tax=Ruegeria sp. HKCCD6428 TaxID=2683002 RepID=UPI0014925E2B|nr:transporter substrate-binding domain-containing protein [Ruegeria sp. HKCCD6428]NOC85526.1 transporter substrate-binding domain-containing protein [Ruegeria sp. HKCCD6428]
MIGRTFSFSLLAAALSTGMAMARCEDRVSQPKPQNASRDILGADLDTIVARGYIKFAAYDDFAPWSYEKDGKIQGVDIDTGTLIAEELGVDARFNLVAAGENLEARLTPELDFNTPPLPGFAVSSWTAGVDVHFAYSGLSYAVDDAIYAALQDRRIAEISKRRGLTHSPPALR